MCLNTRPFVEECAEMDGQKEETDQKNTVMDEGRVKGRKNQSWLQQMVYQLVNWILYTVNFTFIRPLEGYSYSPSARSIDKMINAGLIRD